MSQAKGFRSAEATDAPNARKAISAMLMDRTSAVKKERPRRELRGSDEATGKFHILVMRHQWRSKAPPSGNPTR